MRRWVALACAIGATLPTVASADARYFEFRPDYTQSLLIASAPQPVEQVFLPLNDHVSGFDVWLSNSSIGGPVTIQFYSPADALLGTAAVTVPAIQDSAPQRTKFTLPEQVATNASDAYYVRVSTPIPSMRLHYAQQQTVLAHNAVPQAAYASGLARVGGDERSYAFLFALYEGTESTAPVVTGVTATVLSVQQVQITFHASEPVDASVQYGPEGQDQETVDFTGQYTSCPIGLTACSVMLPIVHPGVEHTFSLTVRDVWGNAAEVTGTFTAAGVELSPTPSDTPTPDPTTPAPTPDVVPPILSNVRVADVTHESVAIAWTTNEAANSLIVVQFGDDRITVGGNSDSTLEFEHLLGVQGLGPFTPYFARVQSADAWGNDTSVVDFEFTTLPMPTPDPSATPTPSVTPTPTVSVGPSDDNGGTEASWAPPAGGAPNGFRIDIIGPDGELIRTIRTFDTSADLGNVPEGASVIVYADRGNGVFEKIAAPARTSKQKSFLERLVLALPYIVGGLGVVLIGGDLGWRFWTRRKEPTPAPESASPQSPFTSAP